MKKQHYVSLDLGSKHVRGVVGIINDEGQLHILAVSKVESKGVQDGVIINLDMTVNAIRSVIENLEAKAGTEINEVYVGISGQKLDVITRNETLIRENFNTEISHEEIQEFNKRLNNILLGPGQVIVDIIPLFYKIDNDNRTKFPAGMNGREVRGYFKVVTCDQKSRAYFDRCIAKANLTQKGIMLNAEAAAWACLTKDDMEEGAVVVDIGADMTDIAFFYDSVLADINLYSIGGNAITNDIQDGCKLMVAKAEKLKKKFGTSIIEADHEEIQISLGARNGSSREPAEISMISLTQIIQARLEDFAMLVNNAIEGSGLRDHLLGGIVLTGGTSQLESIAIYFEERLGLGVRTCEGLAPNFTASEAITRQIDGSYSASIGHLLKVVYAENEKLKRNHSTEEFVAETIISETKETSSKKGIWNSILSYFNSDEENAEKDSWNKLSE